MRMACASRVIVIGTQWSAGSLPGAAGSPSDLAKWHAVVTWVWLGLLGVAGSLPLATQAAQTDEPVDFVQAVRPIFEQHCYACHSDTERESGLRLDVKAAAMKGGDRHGPDIIPGNPTTSPLIQFITADADDPHLMPPGDRLSEVEIEILTRWVREGAVWPDGIDRVELRDPRDHWSFKPLPSEPLTADIDYWIGQRLAQEGLQMAPEASPAIWLRRVTLDLTGLPPTPEEMKDFQQSVIEHESVREREAVYRATVERLLASPHYGERWGQHWLDVVRYADTHGFEVNTERPHAWHYRDYVIRALNADLPYDQFIKEQIAGDALGADAATGFLVTASVLLPGQIGQDPPSIHLARQDAIDEMVNNVSQTFLGLTIGCARCHDHKFDPISARDYYAMQAFVAGVEYEDREIPGPDADQRSAEILPLQERLQQVQEQLTATTSDAGQPVWKPTDPRENIERFEPRLAKFVRLTIYDANHHPTLGLIEPCIDELEIFTNPPAPVNVALASHGTRVTASGSRSSDNHQLEFINDGVYGNHRSWMSDTAGTGWVLFELPEAVPIHQIVWSRDRSGQFTDRLATVYSLEVGATLDDLTVVAGVQPAQLQLWQEKLALEEQLRKLEARQLAFAGKFRTPDAIHLLRRGDPEQPGEPVAAAVPVALGDRVLPYEADEQQRRLALADWIASPENPLTARVLVNRVWHWHFGAGLVVTPSDLGNSGGLPTHPELLDALAQQFMRDGWSIKQLHRHIVLSRTYRQAATIDPRAAQIDADNRWLWRFRTRRLEAEVIRDSMLAVAGLLRPDRYGRGFDLFDQRGGLSGFNPIEELTEQNARRMIYAHKVRREPEAVFGAFDCPDAGQSTAVRPTSTTPIQALNLFNSRFTLLVADAWAERLRGEAGDDLEAQIRRAYELALSRQPTDEELADCMPGVQQFGLRFLCRVLLNSNEFLFLP